VVAAGVALATCYLLWLAVAVAGITGPARELVAVAFATTLLLSPLAILTAMVRHRLYEIDRILGRTFVYAGLTALLAGIFAASQRLLQVIFVALLGESSDVTLVVSTLIVVTAITPLKDRLELVAARWDAEGRPASLGLVADGDATSEIAPTARPLELDPGMMAAVLAAVDRRLDERIAELDSTEGAGEPVVESSEIAGHEPPGDAHSRLT
jgi:hypothetical protein